MENSQHTYVISLKTATARRNHIVDEFSRHSVPFQFFDAITPGASLEASMASLVPNLAQQNKLSAGEKACFMSHVELWKKCVDKNLPFMHIFEDDIFLGKNAQTWLNQNTWLVPNLQSFEPWVVKTETFLMDVNLKPSTIPSFQYYRFDHLLSVHYGTAGYTLSQSAAQYLLDMVAQLPVDKLLPIDHVLFKTYLGVNKLNIFQLVPSICIQVDRIDNSKKELVSQIRQDRREVRIKTKAKMSVFAKLVREIKKIPSAIKKLRFKKVNFDR